MEKNKNPSMVQGGFWQLPQIESISNDLRKSIQKLVNENYCPELIVSEIFKAGAYHALLYSSNPLAQLQAARDMLNTEIITYEPKTLH